MGWFSIDALKGTAVDLPLLSTLRKHCIKIIFMKRGCCVGFNRMNLIEPIDVVAAVAGGRECPNPNNES